MPETPTSNVQPPAPTVGTPPTTDTASSLIPTPQPTAQSASQTPTLVQGPTVPDNYDIKVPEGIELDKAVFDKFVPIAKEMKMDNAQAQKFADLFSDAVRGYEDKAIEGMQKQADTWIAEVKSDKVVGGNNFDGSVGLAEKAVQWAGKVTGMGAEEFRAAVNDLGIGAFPPLFKLLVAVGKELSEGSISGTSGYHVSTTTQEQSDYEKMYPAMKEQLARQGR